MRRSILSGLALVLALTGPLPLAAQARSERSAFTTWAPPPTSPPARRATLPGALIPADSLRRVAHYRPLRPMLLGAAVGGVLGLLWASRAADTCSDCAGLSRGEIHALLAGSGAALGGVLGLGWGLANPHYTWEPGQQAADSPAR
jgi:hypothetical protein